MAATVLADIELNVSLHQFLFLIWENVDFYKIFLQEKMLEKDVNITQWEHKEDGLENNRHERLITSQHPLPISLPWLPMYINSCNIQSLEYDSSTGVLYIRETSVVKGLPGVEPSVITEWEVKELPNNKVFAHVTLRFSYKRWSMLQNLVESHSTTELKNFYLKYKEHVKEAIETAVNQSSIAEVPLLKELARFNGERTRAESLAANNDAAALRRFSMSFEPEAEVVMPSAANTVKRSLLAWIGANVNDEIKSSVVSGCRDYSTAKLAIAVAINSFAPLDVAGFHGISSDLYARDSLNNLASVSIIYCGIIVMDTIFRLSLLGWSTGAVGRFDGDDDENISSVDAGGRLPRSTRFAANTISSPMKSLSSSSSLIQRIRGTSFCSEADQEGLIFREIGSDDEK